MENSNKRILIFIDWFYPAFKAGGPIKSIHNLITNLNSKFEFLIISSNNDIDGEVIDVPPNQLMDKDLYKIIYLDKANQNKVAWSNIYKEFMPEWIYFNSLYSVNFTLKPYLLFRNKEVKKMIAPRGMLGEGSLAIKPTKKKLFLRIAKNFLFDNKLYWHATTIAEKHQIKNKIGLKSKVNCAQNLSSGINLREAYTKQSGQLKLVFLSRISSIKNLDWLLNILMGFEMNSRIQVDIYGPFEDKAYENHIMNLIEQSSFSNYKGEVHPSNITTTLQQYDFYILPSDHENYGHSIIEALQSGVPVIISDKTPWKKLEEEGVGFDLALGSKQPWEELLLNLIELENEAYSLMINNCYLFSKKYIINGDIINQNIELFTQD